MGRKKRATKVTFEDIDHVKNLIEHCLLRYISKEETVDILWKQENVDREFTKIEEIQQHAIGQASISSAAECGPSNANPRSVINYGEIQQHAIGQASISSAAECGPSNANPRSVINYGEIQQHAIGQASISSAAECGPSNANPRSVINYEKIQQHAIGQASISSAAECGPSNANPRSVINYGKIQQHAIGQASISSAAECGPSNTNPRSVINYGEIQQHAIGQASISSAAECRPSNENPSTSINYGGSSRHPNIQVDVSNLWPQRIGNPEQILQHATGNASASLAAEYGPSNANRQSVMDYGGSSRYPNIQVDVSNSWPQRMDNPGQILQHATEQQASASLPVEYGPSNANPPSVINHGGFSGHLNVQDDVIDLFPEDGVGISRQIQQYATTRHASASLAAAECGPINANPPSGFSGHSNLQDDVIDLFPKDGVGISRQIQQYATTRHASASLAAAVECGPINANPPSGFSGHSNVQDDVIDLFPEDGMGILRQIQQHATTRHASASLAAAECGPINANPPSVINHGGFSGLPNNQLGVTNLCPSRMDILDKILYHATGTSLAAEFVPSNADLLSASNNASFPVGNIMETEEPRMLMSQEVIGAANKSYPSYQGNSEFRDDGLLPIHSSNVDVDGAVQNSEFTMPPLIEDPSSFKSSASQYSVELYPDVDECLGGYFDLPPDQLANLLFKAEDDRHSSGPSNQIPNHFSLSGLTSEELAPTSSGEDGISSFIKPGGSSGHQTIQKGGDASVGGHRLIMPTSM